MEMEGFDSALLRDLPGRIFLYPCAGKDWSQAVQVFGEGLDELRFVDINYQFRTPAPIEVDGWSSIAGAESLSGPAIANMTTRADSSGRRYRNIDPAWFSEMYRHQGGGQTVRITRRRGFGQYALHELPDASLGVFFHRGDSDGEGGSGTWFLANKKRSHPPLSMLFDVLKRKLAYPALIASDGSNTTVKALRDTAQEKAGPPDTFVAMGLRWQDVGHMLGKHSRLTVIWKVTPAVDESTRKPQP